MAIESRDPANEGTLTGMMREVLKKWLQSTDDMLPAMVTAYDRTTNRARVQPIIQVMDTDGNLHNRAPVAELPVFLLGAGTFFIGFNITPGDLGWIKANDRDISNFLQEYVNHRPQTNRLHSFEDGLFIPDIMTGYTINAEDSSAMVIQNTTGTVRISLNDQRIKLTAPRVEVNAPTDITGATTITGGLTVDGIVFGSHVHPQANDSGGSTEEDTGPPQN